MLDVLVIVYWSCGKFYIIDVDLKEIDIFNVYIDIIVKFVDVLCFLVDVVLDNVEVKMICWL